MANHDNLLSRGPWEFTNDTSIAPGKSRDFDFRRLTYNGRKRYFAPYLPLDSAQVTNADTANQIRATFNNRYPTRVMPNSVEGFAEQGITSVKIENVGGSEIAEGDVIVEVSKDAYDSDDAARAEAERHPLSKAFENFTGVRL